MLFNWKLYYATLPIRFSHFHDQFMSSFKLFEWLQKLLLKRPNLLSSPPKMLITKKKERGVDYILDKIQRFDIYCSASMKAIASR